MPQLLATVLVVACCLAGTVFLVAAALQKSVIRLSPKQREMSRPIHVLAAMLFFGMPVLMYCRSLPWPVQALYMGVTAAAILYACVIDGRGRRRPRAG